MRFGTIAAICHRYHSRMADSARHVAFDACFNFRDLGGYATNDGARRIRWTTVYRSGSLHRLTATDLDAAHALGVHTVIDLRSSGERERHGRAALLGEVAVHHVPIFEEDALPFERLHPDSPEPAVRDDYFVMAVAGSGAIVESLRIIAEDQHPVVFHCAAGKDRTGILAAILLASLGVPDEVIATDYQLSDPAMERFVAWATTNSPVEAADMATLPDWLTKSPETLILTFLQQVRARYGSIEDYLTDVGLEEEVVPVLRDRLLEPVLT
jgi:protein-tyrosine phosphatase